MKKNFNHVCIAKTATIFIAACLSFVNLPLYGQNDAVKDKSEIAKFEIGFAEYRISQAGTDAVSADSAVVYLFGFTTLPDADTKKFGAQAQAQSGKEKTGIPPHFYLSADKSILRLYTFLRAGEIEYEGKSYTADARGTVKLPASVDVSKIRILGKKTAKGDVAGSGNTPLSSFYQYADRKIAVYELGAKTAGDMN
jgi:hypothetical protein